MQRKIIRARNKILAALVNFEKFFIRERKRERMKKIKEKKKGSEEISHKIC